MEKTFGKLGVKNEKKIEYVSPYRARQRVMSHHDIMFAVGALILEIKSSTPDRKMLDGLRSDITQMMTDRGIFLKPSEGASDVFDEFIQEIMSGGKSLSE